MSEMKFQRGLPRKVKQTSAALAFATLVCGSFAFAQGTLPLPAPGAAPATPAAPAGDNATRARAAALAAKANVDITEAWTRATNQPNAPIYMHIVSAKDPDRLVGIEVAMAKTVELRDDSPQAQTKVMPNPVVDVPAGGTVNLAPGGKYFNLVGLKAPLKEGDSFLVTFKFDKAGTSTAAVKILGSGATGVPLNASARRGDTTAGVTQR